MADSSLTTTRPDWLEDRRLAAAAGVAGEAGVGGRGMRVGPARRTGVLGGLGILLGMRSSCLAVASELPVEAGIVIPLCAAGW